MKNNIVLLISYTYIVTIPVIQAEFNNVSHNSHGTRKFISFELSNHTFTSHVNMNLLLLGLPSLFK